MKPLVSIIIPTFQRAHLIGETLDSLIDQKYPYWECIVIDDGSTDYTVELMEFYCEKSNRIKYYHRPSTIPKGANSCRNYGFKISKGKYVKWFDSDDLFQQDYLEKKMKLFLQKSYNLIICNTAYFERDKKCPNNIFYNISNDDDLLTDYLSGKVNINVQAVLWERKVIEEFEYNENLERAQELEFHFRVLRSIKLRAGFVREILVSIRGHGESLTGNYNRGELKSITSELEVRRSIIEYLLKKNYSAEIIDNSITFYVRALRNLCRNHQLILVLKELNLLKSVSKEKNLFFYWRVQLIIILIFYKITGRDFQLKRTLHHLNKILCKPTL